ncbi:MAG TPA: DUF1461 domain-containing protein [Anaerolineales bacterium]|nr:DUF1461 domain-containing protein [Anaerolineales bacterium]
MNLWTAFILRFFKGIIIVSIPVPLVLGSVRLLLTLVIGLLAVVAWQAWFVAFHEVFFAPGSWTFNYTHTLIRLFPEKFWFDAALTIASLSLTGGLLLALAGWRWRFQSPSEPVKFRQTFRHCQDKKS